MGCTPPKTAVDLAASRVIAIIDRPDWNGRWYVFQNTERSATPYCLTFRDSAKRESLAQQAMMLGYTVNVSANPGGVGIFISYETGIAWRIGDASTGLHATNARVKHHYRKILVMRIHYGIFLVTTALISRARIGFQRLANQLRR